jgi:hypothetical protein
LIPNRRMSWKFGVSYVFQTLNIPWHAVITKTMTQGLLLFKVKRHHMFCIPILRDMSPLLVLFIRGNVYGTQITFYDADINV